MHDFDASTFCSAENSVIRSYMKLSGHLCTSGLGLRAMQVRQYLFGYEQACTHTHFVVDIRVCMCV